MQARMAIGLACGPERGHVRPDRDPERTRSPAALVRHRLTGRAARSGRTHRVVQEVHALRRRAWSRRGGWTRRPPRKRWPGCGARLRQPGDRRRTQRAPSVKAHADMRALGW